VALENRKSGRWEIRDGRQKRPSGNLN
jgi:hypothetical protein